MTLAAGHRLGPYEILDPLGSGGMGEVYRAEDTRLHRTVAIKVLPAALAREPDRRERLEREARLLAGLSHPNICALHDVGHEDGVDFLVMEHLEGETLEARLERGPLPLEQAVRLGVDVAEALDAAHRRGLVHRDLKPGNLMLTRSGVKLLDFGLARPAAPVAPTAAPTASEAATRSRRLTAEGTILGTAPYMAPEQLEGGEADARTDIFALGAVLYEAVTGARAFEGDSQASILAAILRAEPAPMQGRLPRVPAALERAVRRCLAKEPEQRWQSVRDLMLELRWIAGEGEAPETAEPRPAPRRWREGLAWILAVVAGAACLGLWLQRAPGPEVPPARLSLSLPPEASRVFTSIAPDAGHVAISAVAGGQRQLWLRPLDAVAARRLPGTEGGGWPFWSPDSRFLAFFADRKLKKIGLAGGPPQVLCDAPGSFAAGTWGADGTILFSILEAPEEEGIYRVSSEGGPATPVNLRSDDGGDLLGLWPSFLPDGRHFLFVCLSGIGAEDGAEKAALCVADRDGGPAEALLSASPGLISRAFYAPPGYLLYTRDGALMAHPFDADNRRLEGNPSMLAGRVEQGLLGLDHFSVSDNGVLVYEEPAGGSRLVWKDRNGRITGEIGPAGGYLGVRLAPGGDRLSVTLENSQTSDSDIWILDLDRNVSTRFTTEPDDEMATLWSPDGERLVYSASRGAAPFLHVRTIAGGEEEILLPATGTLQIAYDWSPDGSLLLYGNRDPETGMDVWMLPVENNGEPVPLLRSRFEEAHATFSPDGRWLAYESDESGRFEVYVQPFPGPGERRRVSTDGGRLPRWRGDGREIFYESLDDRLMTVPLDGGDDLRPGAPTALFTIDADPGMFIDYDVQDDGQRFVVGEAIPGAAAGPVVIIDWTAALRR